MPGVGSVGPRGPGVVAVVVEPGITVPRLDPILNDPEGDFTLVLPPLGGNIEAPPANHVAGANFVHEEILTRNQFEERFTNQADDNRLNGFLIAFEQPVRVGSLNNRTAYAYINARGQQGNPLALLPLIVLPVQFDPGPGQIDVTILDGYRSTSTAAEVLPLAVGADRLIFDPNDVANGVILAPRVTDSDTAGLLFDLIVRLSMIELMPPRDLDPDAEQGRLLSQVTIVLRGDQIVTPEGFFLDGNNMGRIDPGAPIFASGNGTPGGDWVAVIHLETVFG